MITEEKNTKVRAAAGCRAGGRHRPLKYPFNRFYAPFPVLALLSVALLALPAAAAAAAVEARAFATEADILLMDEPFSALDPVIRTKLQDELLTLQRQVRKTILFVSHDLDEALKLGNRISILEGGRIVQTGTPQDIVLRPVNDYVAEFVRHMNPLTVLTGGMIMRAQDELVREGQQLWLDAARRYQITLDARGECTALRVDGATEPFARLEDFAGDEGLPPGLVIASMALPLQRIIQLRQLTGHPVLLAHDGVVSGVCDECEIVRALAGRPVRSL
jgi:glycine betaine/proline transport system ATP-binding protein